MTGGSPARGSQPRLDRARFTVDSDQVLPMTSLGGGQHVARRFLALTRVPKTYAAFVQEQRRLARQFEEERARWRSRQG
jgi:hypothetical protein